MLELVSVAGMSDAELLERVYAGDRGAEERLLARHRSAVEILPNRAPYFSANASGQGALWWIPKPDQPRLPFRAVWLALRAHGLVPAYAPAEHEAAWNAYTSLSPAQRLAVWHREVEGQRLDEIAGHLALTDHETLRLLTASYAEIGRALPAAEVDADLRFALADVVLGPHAAAYLARRPRPARLPDPDTDRLRRRGPVVVVGVAATAVAAMVLVLANPAVSPAPEDPRVRVEGSMPGSILRPDVGNRPDAPRQAAPTRDPDDAARSAPAGSPGGAPGAPPQSPSTDPGPDPDPGPDSTNPPPPQAPPPVDVQVTQEAVTVAVDTQVTGPVVVEVPLPAVHRVQVS
jgi:hypothetical protein